MGLDALESSHPISIVVHHPDEIAEIFDGISYSKGILKSLCNLHCYNPLIDFVSTLQVPR